MSRNPVVSFQLENQLASPKGTRDHEAHISFMSEAFGAQQGELPQGWAGPGATAGHLPPHARARGRWMGAAPRVGNAAHP